ncbi:uncharacterized protein BDR25DRAFT_49311 [Lindgomyces ingoldianus]|uniref:Uncharacterized protein n=1 Tax=Lindgomyces ingoldianus TaxID=673940 RepID=A0ACB6QRB3_9PLEO|nr:uncharacterized protein BDR25DRAFT_49311 [Lindgomyces ingoldianus]KAF2469425.1 hypothetical protein BDR25DRAFT_49311 [Lindgomyces ingoldianus]
MSGRSNQWFVPGDGIAREVITADIQRYLGPNALVRPGIGTGEHEGRPGYLITAYRTLTTQMIADLKLDSQRWQQEAGRVAYQDSRTHAARQHWGPSAVTAPTEYPQTCEPQRSGYSQYGGQGENSAYTTAPPPTQYTSQQPGYTVSPQATHHAQPRTQPQQDSYPGYSSQSREQSAYSMPYYPSQAPQDPPRANPPPPQYNYSTQPRYFGYFDDHFLVYR